LTIKKTSERYGISEHTLRYYEKIGMIPPVTRTSSGIRDYRDEDLEWVELVLCMRNAGLPVKVMVEYLRLFQMGDSTIVERLNLLLSQQKILLEQKKNIDETLNRLNYKISRYEVAVKTGKLTWDED
ncbi:MAG: MerR family transcriptional regulator, partial [Sphaerochaetaceae bacterium]|jgi:DNA-binding transcriptional MerR regulator|nr:MerR family transcriptional regulator [Sphaerochaetaceae bacterium]